MTRPPHTDNPAYSVRETLLASLVLGLLGLGLVVFLAAPLQTLLALVAVVLVGTGLGAVLAARRRTSRERTVCLPLIPVCVTV